LFINCDIHSPIFIFISLRIIVWLCLGCYFCIYDTTRIYLDIALISFNAFLFERGDEVNERQKHFADEYIISKNATQSAIKAGYSEKTARSIGQKLLTKVDISEYIQKRTQELFDERSMTIAEALAISASIARGEVQKGYSKKTVKTNGREEVVESTYEFTPSIEERQRSVDHIFRVNGAYLERKEIEMSALVQFIDDIGVDDEIS